MNTVKNARIASSVQNLAAPIGNRGLLILALAWPLCVQAQEALKTIHMMPAVAESRPFVFFETISKKEGLPPNMHKIRQDSSGYIWLLGETGQGAVKFDGAEFHPVSTSPADIHGLSARTINDIYPEPNGDIWLATDRGVYFYEAGTGHLHPKTCSFTTEFISIIRDKKGRIWAGSKEGLATCVPKTDSIVSFPKGVLNGYSGEFLPKTYFNAFPQLFEHPNGKIWSVAVLYREKLPNVVALVEIDPDKNTLQYFPLPGTFRGEVFDIGHWNQLDVMNQCIWIPYETTLLKFSLLDYSFEEIRMHDSKGRSPFLTNVKMLGKNRIWVTSSDGLFLFDLAARRYHEFAPPVNVARKSVNGHRCRDILTVSDGTIWCLYEDYLAKIDPKRQLFPLISQGSSNFDTEEMFVLPKPKMLLQLHFEARRTLSIHALHLVTGRRLRIRQKIPGSSIGPAHISNSLTLSDGKILLGMNCGLAWLDIPSLRLRSIHSTIEKMPAPGRTENLWISDMLEDKTGDIWISTWNAGIIRYQTSKNKFINYTFDLGGAGKCLYNKSYLSLKLDSLGRFVFGGNGTGLEIWDPASSYYKHVTGETRSERSLQARFIYCQFVDKRKRHWIGTENGLFQYSAGAPIDQAFLHYKVGGWIFDMVSDALGRFWLKTSLGLVLFDPESGKQQLFGEAQGMTLQPPFAHKILFLENDHRLWFGESLHFDPLSINFFTLNVRPALTGLKIHDRPWKNGAPLVGIRHIDLAYNEQTLRFEFTALDFGVAPGEQMYMVKLTALPSGFWDSESTSDWINLGHQPYATFANLAPGKYRLSYRCGNSEAGWLPESLAVTLDFTIHPHWSQTWWFRILLGLAIVAIGAFGLAIYYRFRLRAQQLENEKAQREAERRQLEMEKATISADSRRKAAESEMKRLRSQLNPHFLFNALNSINLYILAHDRDKASEYLGQFAQLTRSILDNSRTLTIPLAHELKMLNSYIALESLRFKEQITWHFALHPEIDEEVVQVPSLFLQPFVENAILHGLAPKGGGHIHLDIDIRGNSLYCTLRDNGVGRRLSSSPPLSEMQTGYASAGMGLISERLEAFAYLEGQATDIQIIDLQNEDGTPAGTEVRIVLPLLESV